MSAADENAEPYSTEEKNVAISPWNSSNVTISPCDSSGWGNMSWSEKEVILLFYILVAIFGTIGNSLVLLVYLGKKRLKEQPTSIFIINLALCDLTVSVLLIPFKVVTYQLPHGWAGDMLCRLFISQYFLWSCGGASAYTLFWVTVERYVSICMPFRYSSMFTFRTTVLMCLSAWILGLSLESYEFTSFHYSYKHQCCVFETTTYTRLLIVTEGCLILGINGVMLLVYSKIAWTLHNNMRDMKKQGVPLTDPRQYEMIVAKKNLAKLMFIVLGAYFTCWVGVGVCNVWTAAWPGVYETWFGEVFMLLATLNSTCNFLIYAFKSVSFRHSLKQRLSCGSRCRGENNTNSSSLPVFV